MHQKKTAILALALIGILLLGALTFGANAQRSGGRKPQPKTNPLVAQGKKVYDANGCAACHAIAGKGGKSAPDLTRIGREHKADWLGVQIRDPRKNTPGSSMPAYGPEQISDKDLKALVAYLSSLK
jgi:mono/diheme cytochrome c family protein